jgi:sarcosine oxidase subunit alpha
VPGRRIVSFPRGEPTTVFVDGDPVRAYAGESLAAALFASGVRVLSRSSKYHRPRTFFCLAGHCGACLMRVDGVPSLRSCRVPVREGLRCERQNAFPSPDADLLAGADWMFPEGMDHHTLLARRPLLSFALRKAVRRLGGLGRLPDAPAPVIPPLERRHVEVAVIGGGPAGLACAAAAARRGREVLLVDEDDHPGGSLLAEPPEGRTRALHLADEARAAGAELLTGATALGWFPEDEGGLLAIETSAGLLRLSADRTVYATGAYDQNILCEDNDRPGVIAARAVGRLLVRHGIEAGTRVAIVGPSAYGDRLAGALTALDVSCVRLPAIARVLGSRWVSGALREDGVRVDCDVVAAAAEPLPASDLPRQQGVRVADHRRAFAVLIDEQGCTSVPGIFACGDVTGPTDPARALEQGAALGGRI